ncbi:LysR family transcriptional regulator [Laribacter hongkongensis]|uniref:LysR family transcriptional regulator n=1 Tax=Laribacter hongkongensis TaxID=168471 RepID=UPI001EFD5347|nr:LysR family transcriptional regulator [Laribacter hongkongensis]
MQVYMDYLVGDFFTFVSVVETGSFTGTGHKLGMTNSAVSKQISRLERRLRVKLLYRTTRALSLTEAGNMVYARCARILEDVHDIEQTVANLQSAPSGQLRVTASTVFGNLHLSKLLPEFLTRYPNMQVSLGLTDRFVDLIEEGFDIAIRMTSNPSPNLVARLLAPIRYVICCAPCYAAHHGTVTDPAALAEHNCLRFGYKDASSTWSFFTDSGEIKVEISGNLIVNSSESLLNATLSGLGIALLPTFAAGPALQEGRLMQLLPEYRARGQFGQHIYAIFQSDRYQPPKVRAFIDFLIEKLRAEPYWDASSTTEETLGEKLEVPLFLFGS